MRTETATRRSPSRGRDRDRPVPSGWSRAAGAAALAAAGCGGPAVLPDAPPRSNYEVRQPADARPVPPVVSETARPAAPEVSWDTERDGRYARFLRDNAGGMIRRAAVGIERRGVLRVEISRAVEPDDTLALTKSLMAGARKDFPESPITLSLYDPAGAPVLTARYRPGEGVRYQIAHEGEGQGQGAGSSPPASPSTGSAGRASPERSGAGDALSRGGVTERDRAFAAWAGQHGKPYLRYVEADLERHGRLWFGITREVNPEDVKPLARSLLQGARKEFPRGALVATVFDPDGERIGRARLDGGGEVVWER